MCTIRDCIDKTDYGGFELGRAVYENGAEVSAEGGGLCFDRRRNHSASATLARVDLNRLVSALDARAAVQAAEVECLREGRWRDVQSIAYEDLAEYEYDARAASCRSLDAWLRLLRPSLGGVPPNRTLVRDYLLSMGGTRARASHNDTIYNYDAVAATLRDSRYSVLLRRPGGRGPSVVGVARTWWNFSEIRSGRPLPPIAAAAVRMACGGMGEREGRTSVRRTPPQQGRIPPAPPSENSWEGAVESRGRAGIDPASPYRTHLYDGAPFLYRVDSRPSWVAICLIAKAGSSAWKMALILGLDLQGFDVGVTAVHGGARCKRQRRLAHS